VSNLVIVAIPDENDHVWKVSSEKVPHLTVLFLGDVDQISNLETVVQFVEHAANTTLNRFYLPVDRRGELGADKADVLFFKKGRYDYKAIRDFRVSLLQNNNIKTAYDSAQQFEGPWNPHLTLGYPEDPAKEEDPEFGFYSVYFNKIAVWTGDFEGPEFLLTDEWDEFEALETVPMDVAMSDIRHHGVKGMKWGVRKLDQLYGKAERIAGDRKFKKRTNTADTAIGLISEARSGLAKDLPEINTRHKALAKTGGKNQNLTNLSRVPAQKAYKKEVQDAFLKHLNAAAEAKKNPSGTKKYTIEAKSASRWKVKLVDVAHADTSEFEVEPVFDSDGFIIDIKLVEDAMAQTTDLGAEFILEHYGIKGMHWGQRKAREVTTQSHVDSGVFKRRTEVRSTGGEAHDAHPDAVMAAVQKQKLKKSGTNALSTQELRELANRLQVENQVSILMSSKGKQFVSKQLEQEGKAALRKGTQKAAPHVIRRASKGAATVATTAALL
jgi:2'-5' RNA ligase